METAPQRWCVWPHNLQRGSIDRAARKRHWCGRGGNFGSIGFHVFGRLGRLRASVRNRPQKARVRQACVPTRSAGEMFSYRITRNKLIALQNSAGRPDGY